MEQEPRYEHEYRRCTKCGHYKIISSDPKLSQFPKPHFMSGKQHPWCKACMKIARDVARAKKPAHYREKSREWNRLNPDKVKDINTRTNEKRRRERLEKKQQLEAAKNSNWLASAGELLVTEPTRYYGRGSTTDNTPEGREARRLLQSAQDGSRRLFESIERLRDKRAG